MSDDLPGGSFEGCVDIMLDDGHDEQAAENICGALRAEAKSDHGNVEELRQALERGRGLIADVGVDLVSGVDVPAIDSKWVMLKSADETQGHDYRVNTPILLEKNDDEEKRISYAAAMIPREPDKEGDVVATPTVEKAAHDFLVQHGGVDTDHSLIDGEGEVVESWVLKEVREFDLPDGSTESYPAGAWMVGIKWESEPWERIKEGELTGLSIYGMADHVALKSTELSSTKHQNGDTLNIDASKSEGMGSESDETAIDAGELADSLAEPLGKAVSEAVKDAFEEVAPEEKAPGEDLSSIIDDAADRLANHEEIEQSAADLRDAIKQALRGESEKAEPVAEGFDETVEVGDSVTVGFKSDADVDTDAVAEAVTQAMKAEDGDDDEDDDEEEKAADDVEKRADSANLSKGADARDVAAEGIEKGETAGTGSIPSFREAAEQQGEL